MRPIHLLAPTWQAPASQPERLDIPVEVITPLFGGSASAGDVDSALPVRSAGIRGLLRYWWRATAGPFSSPGEMFEKEASIWGSTERHGSVSLSVQITNAGGKARFGVFAPKARPQEGPLLGYFLFPFDADSKGKPVQDGCKDVRFTLHLAFPSDHRDEVDRAVHAWLLFSGVGARTRRGCGALDSEKYRLPADPNQRIASLRCLFPELQPDPNPSFSTLSGAQLVIGGAQNDALAAWKSLARFWCAFHKGHVGNRAYASMNGGVWEDHKHLQQWRSGRDEIALSKPDLGLPIIYQSLPGGGGRPPSFGGTLEPAQSGRMASPVILRPIRLSNNEFAPLVLILRSPHCQAIKIDRSKPVRLKGNPNDPVLQDLNVDNPLDAVIAAALQHWSDAQVLTIGGAS